MKKFWIQTLGCKANFSDGQQIESGLRRAGMFPAKDLKDADLIVVNSCTVTNEADTQSRKSVTQAHRKNPRAKIVYTGCGAEVNPESALSIPGISFVLGNQNKNELANLISNKFDYDRGDNQSVSEVPAILGGVRSYTEMKSQHPEDREWLEPELDSENLLNLERGEGTFRTRAFLRIQEGCNHFCTYCVIPYGRGPSRSVSKDQILKTAEDLVNHGTKEIVLTGTNIGDTDSFEDIVEDLLQKVQVPRLRLSSLDPVEISPRLLDFIAKYENLCPHFHVSLQSPHAKILKLMKRKYSSHHVVQCLKAISELPRSCFVGMDVITGFPGEDEVVFQETLMALKELPWTRLHVFPYSERAGTPATRLGNSVEFSERKERAKILNEISLNRMTDTFQKSRQASSGAVLLKQVLFESIVRPKGHEKSFLSGYSQDYQRVWLPISDLVSPESKLNKIFDVKASTWARDRIANEVYWIGTEGDANPLESGIDTH